MSKVRIVTDSTAQLDPRVIKKLNMVVLPLGIHFDNQHFQEGIDLTTEEFYQRIAHSSVMPTSTAPTVDMFRQVYSRLSQQTDKVVSLHVSSQLNATCRNARAAADYFLGRCEIIVLDSWTVSLGLSILVQAGAQAALKGASLDDVVRIIRGMTPHIYAVFFTDTLDYLERKKSISKSQSFLGTMLSIKPFLMIEEGEIIPIEKMRTRDKAIDKLIEFVSEFSNIEQIVVLKSGVYLTEESRSLSERLRSVFPTLNFSSINYSPVLATHIGPNSLGLIVYEGMGQ